MKYIRLHQNLNEDFIDDFDDFDNGISSMDNIIANNVAENIFETYKFYIMFFISLMLKCSKTNYFKKITDWTSISSYQRRSSDPLLLKWIKDTYKNPDFETENNELWKVDELIRKNKAGIESVVDNLIKCLNDLGIEGIYDPFGSTLMDNSGKYNRFLADYTTSKLNLPYDEYFCYSSNILSANYYNTNKNTSYHSIENKSGSISVNLILKTTHQWYDFLDNMENFMNNWFSNHGLKFIPDIFKYFCYLFYFSSNESHLNSKLKNLQTALNNFEVAVNKYLVPITLKEPIKFKLIIEDFGIELYNKKQLNYFKTHCKFCKDLFSNNIINIVNRGPGENFVVIDDFIELIKSFPETLDEFSKLIKK